MDAFEDKGKKVTREGENISHTIDEVTSTPEIDTSKNSSTLSLPTSSVKAIPNTDTSSTINSANLTDSNRQQAVCTDIFERSISEVGMRTAVKEREAQ
jgi:hypothetical protein